MTDVDTRPHDPTSSWTWPPPHTRGRWSAELWEAMAPAYDAVLAHPFLTGLADGTLDPDSFTHYVAQDAHYLRDYARALATLAGRATDPRDAAALARHASGALEVEQELHHALLDELGLDAAALAATAVAPTTHAYTRHLLAATALGSYADGLAAVLPCYWIYARVGVALMEHGSPEPRYQRWIDTYAGGDFQGVVAEVVGVVDRVGPGLTDDQRAAARVEAVTSARYEWMFWDAALRLEGWVL